ncbi:Phytochrome-like protein cph1 [Flavobacterium columnare]|uniref:PAS domain S-box protein n=3 Tax=Flavobacterium TaxID=237 RepID=A0A2N9PB50_9FLAO|nr:PAS domain S-box protein [Flavobacterium columnare]RVU90913.1 PAS domain S-box protein [Flavobacterium columnare]SPE77565.1 Phytochrome-like protein cph1 [Flavobacterium columnare]
MRNIQFNFNVDEFNSIFPFHILIDDQLKILSLGKTLNKLLPEIELDTSFIKSFDFQRPHFENINATNFIQTLNQLVVLHANNKKVILRGQINPHGKFYLFTGSPWFNSIQEVVENNLTFQDFAFNDPLIDLLHVLKNQEIQNQELNELVIKINEQQKILEKDKEELQVLSSIAKVNLNAVIICDKEGKIEWVNESFEKVTGYNNQEVIGKKPGSFLQGKETSRETVAYLKKQLSTGEPFNCEILNYTKDKTKYWVRIHGQALKNSDGQIIKYFAIEEDISNEKSYQEALKYEKEKYSSIIANMNLGLLEVDNNDFILFSNQSFLDMSGYTANEIIGKNATDLLANEKSKTLLADQNKARKQGISDSYEVLAKTKKGEDRYWVISGGPNYDEKGNIIGSIGIHLDVTQQKNLELQKERLLLKLKKQNQQLNDYAQIVSHDLKSPLRSIHSLISWIKEDNLKEFSEQTLSYLEMIESKVEKMDHLIQGILTYSKIDTLENVYEEVNTNEIIQNIIQIIHIPENVKVTIANVLPIIQADQYRIQQLFQNLISNAVTYIDKPQGQVIVDYKDNNDSHLFSISDNGPGIAPENQDKIFTIFQSFTKHEKSTGIGLSIVKKIIENYKGEIWLKSQENIGTTFFIKIPKSIQ